MPPLPPPYERPIGEESESLETEDLQPSVVPEGQTTTSSIISSPSDLTNEPPSTTTSPNPVPVASLDEENNTSDEDRENLGATSSDEAQPPPPLYKSGRFKGYLTVFLASIVSYIAATLSDNPLDLTAVQAKDHQRAYAMTVGLISAIVTGMVVVIHIDRYSPLESMLWRKAFGPQSKFETVLVFSLILWWFVAAIVQTSVRGIAGDGKSQYNLFYSSWVCCWTTLWIGEGMVVDYGYPTFRTFVTSWPYRAPGWIAIFLVDLFTLWWYINLFNNTKRNVDWLPEQTKPFYEDIPEAQYQLMLFVSAITLVPSAAFIIVEILRGSELGNDKPDESLGWSRRSGAGPPLPSPANGLMAVSHETSQEHQQPEKKSVEIILEGICLLCLTVMWILSVIVVTTPGGFANQVGNAYFCTWATTLFVLETFLWFIHDWRKSVFKALQQKEAEYRRHQRQVLETTMLKLHGSTDRRGHPTDSGGENDYDYDDDEYDLNDDDDDEMSDDDYNDAEQYKEQKDPRARAPTLDIHSGEPDDSAAAQELRLKQANERAYFDTLDDILE